MSNNILIIPARMDSSRFPGKPLKKINGIPMIGHCYYRAKMSKMTKEVYVATCDTEIESYIHSIGGKAIMTSADHERASDRVSEAMVKIEKEKGYKTDIIILYQGDEPMVTPEMIDLSINKMLADNNVEVINLMSEINSEIEFKDPNEVKVVVDNNNDAIYFSREPIPSTKKYSEKIKKYKQVCVIPFRRNSLIEFNNTQQTYLEEIESIDMLRIIQIGKKVRMVNIDKHVFSVDTPSDLKKVEDLMTNDKLIKLYGQ